MGRIIFLSICVFLISLVNSCRTDWYRKLPDIPQYETTRNYFGTWKKISNPRSAINSSWHKNEWSEKIVFYSDYTFIKTYESKDFIGETLVERMVEGKGVYKVHKNWILLTTQNIFSSEKKDSVLQKTNSISTDSSLLYYYYLDKNLIIPMIYEMGYEEKNFGVKDGVVEPYLETNANFFHYIKIYAFKEFQSHAYYPEN